MKEVDWTKDDNRIAFSYGWGIFNDEGRLVIWGLDDPESTCRDHNIVLQHSFSKVKNRDKAAVNYIRRHAKTETNLGKTCQKALLIIKEHKAKFPDRYKRFA